MENSYGIGVSNRYALFLDDDSDPLETLNLKEREKESKKKSKHAKKEKKAEPVQKQTKDVKSNYKRSTLDEKPERNINEDLEDWTYNGQTDYQQSEDRPQRENIGDNSENRERGERRAVGNKPAGPRRNFDDRRGKREFDRQSRSEKTGVKSVDKRDGAGAHNWGSDRDVIEEADKPDDSWGDIDKLETSTASETKEETADEVPIVEELKEMTLDEWKALRASRLKPQYNVRKAGEGEEPRQWNNMYEVRKKEDKSESQDKECKAVEYPQRVGRQKFVLDIDIQFNDSRRGAGRGRGQRSARRGNQRGSGRRGASEGDRSERRYSDEQGDESPEKRRAPNVDDERDFPYLG